LVADDDDEFAASFQILLEGIGCTVTRVASAYDALKLAKTRSFDGVILDIRLPDLSGYTIARQLRMLPAYSRALIIGISGWHPVDGTDSALHAGFDYFFLKPLDFEDLEQILSKDVCQQATARPLARVSKSGSVSASAARALHKR
jgi:CheY-like chemotaxis protein